MHTTSYNGEAFVDACRKAGVRPVIASDRCHRLDEVWQWPADAVLVDFADPAATAAAIAARVREGHLPHVLAVIPVGSEAAALAATLISERLGLLTNSSAAVEAAGNKLRMRELCAAAAAEAAAAAASDGSPPLAVPRFRVFPFDADPGGVTAQVTREIGWPCVVKPLLLSGSRGVIRADDPTGLTTALARVHKLLSDPALLAMADDLVASRQILIESFVSGPEVAVEGLLTDGVLRTLAVFDKPDPLDGPFFEETIYVTPSRHAPAVQARVEASVVRAARAIGLRTGPIHAEIRLAPPDAGAGAERLPTAVVIEIAARSIGGLCSRTLRFGTGLSLEDLLIRHALQQGDGGGDGGGGLGREGGAAGVMMIPIPRAGVLGEVRGVPAARALPGIEDVAITIRPGETLVPLPEGASYLGFIFARGQSPSLVEATLREAHGLLSFEIVPRLPLA